MIKADVTVFCEGHALRTECSNFGTHINMPSTDPWKNPWVMDNKVTLNLDWIRNFGWGVLDDTILCPKCLMVAAKNKLELSKRPMS